MILLRHVQRWDVNYMIPFHFKTETRIGNVYIDLNWMVCDGSSRQDVMVSIAKSFDMPTKHVEYLLSGEAPIFKCCYHSELIPTYSLDGASASIDKPRLVEMFKIKGSSYENLDAFLLDQDQIRDLFDQIIVSKTERTVSAWNWCPVPEEETRRKSKIRLEISLEYLRLSAFELLSQTLTKAAHWEPTTQRIKLYDDERKKIVSIDLPNCEDPHLIQDRPPDIRQRRRHPETRLQSFLNDVQENKMISLPNGFNEYFRRLHCEQFGFVV